MVIAFVLQAVCLCWSLTVGRVVRRLVRRHAGARYFTWGEVYSLFPATLRRLLRHAARDVELQRALHRQGRGVDHRRLARGAALRAVRQLVDAASTAARSMALVAAGMAVGLCARASARRMASAARHAGGAAVTGRRSEPDAM